MLRQTCCSVAAFLYAVTVFLATAFPVLGQAMSVYQDVHHDVSPALRDLPSMPQAAPNVPPREAEPIRPIPLPPGLKPPGQPDPVIQER
jgi:hypothetical protein